ncbi:polysaccharide deacetylase family protein [Paenibacillus thermoaerophilus]|nr:polysaccharide deacetylase family protein [Paenibacillus thermoaerophilus]
MPTAAFSSETTDNLKLTPDGEEALLEDSAIRAAGVAPAAKAKPASNQALQRKYPSVLVMKGSGDKRQLALTFDDGPDRRFTPQVLEVLKKHGVKATFFMIGSRVQAHSDVAKRVADEGHVIGNHTFWHPKLYSESLDRLRWEATETDRVIEEAVGYKPKLFRAPYGGLTDEILQELGRMKYNVIGWSVDSLDWKQIPAETCIANVMKDVSPGGIVLMHSGGHWTEDLSGMVEALDRLIPMLRQDGYQFVTIPEMIETTASR